jgi:hypothetical protein
VQQRLIYGGKQMYVDPVFYPLERLFTARRRCGEAALLDLRALRAGETANADWCCRADDKSAADYNLEGGATLHLVLALRGGR